MLHWLKSLFVPPRRFRIPPRRGTLPACHIRVYEEADFEACAEIYRLNEPGRFPDGYFDVFAETLTNGDTLFLLCEVDGEIRGLGGVSTHVIYKTEVDMLSFGMVHPNHHGKGFGTWLLLARLAMLPDFSYRTIHLFPVKTSASFYRRFGFNYVSTEINEKGLDVDFYLCELDPPTVENLRQIFGQASIDLPAAEVPLKKITLTL